jgi:hypothetical protein
VGVDFVNPSRRELGIDQAKRALAMLRPPLLNSHKCIPLFSPSSG